MKSMSPEALRVAASAIAAALTEREFGRGPSHGSSRDAGRRDEITRLVARLDAEGFQLAIVGQFKRGKSTLVNALVGYPLVATGVLPLTASPTFLARGDAPSLAVVEDGRIVISRDYIDLDGLAAAIGETTHARDNVEMRRVEVGVPAVSSCTAPSSLLDALVLIDTPGIGSTQRRSSEAAVAALPECDAALFVTSVDPPITEAELDYLGAVIARTEAIVFVLNKIDLPDEEERAALVAFTREAVAGIAGADAPVFALSARSALRARMAGDAEALKQSGLSALEAHVREALLPRKRGLLHTAVAQRLLAIAAEVEREIELERRTLLMPLDELDRTIARLDEAQQRLIEERFALQDRFAGEWRRTLAVLEASCAHMEARVAEEIAGVLEEAHVEADAVEHRFAASFATAFAAIIAEVNALIGDAVERHRARWSALDACVRRLTCEITGVEMPPQVDVGAGAIGPSFTPFWIGPAEIDSLGSLTADAASLLLPRRMRLARQRRRLREAVEKAARRNATQLHWAAKQAIDDAFRLLLARAPGAVDVSLAAAREVAEAARRRRREENASNEEEICRLMAVHDALVNVRGLLVAEPCIRT